MYTVEILKFKPYGVYTNLDTAFLGSLLKEIYNEAVVSSPFRAFTCSHLVYRFIVELRNCIDTSASGHRNYPVRIQPVISFIESNYNKTPSLEDMAAVIGVTTRHLCRLFKQSLNITPFDYLTGYRIKKAKEILISESNPTIKEAAEMSGYHNTSYFCSVFKEKRGLPLLNLNVFTNQAELFTLIDCRDYETYPTGFSIICRYRLYASSHIPVASGSYTSVGNERFTTSLA